MGRANEQSVKLLLSKLICKRSGKGGVSPNQQQQQQQRQDVSSEFQPRTR